jgi:uroporphyrinogen-III synthase
MRVLVTRPLPEGERTATALRGRGHDVLLAPLMRAEPVAADLDGKWSGVIITSANAVRALSEAQRVKLVSLPVFVVGRRSAEAAREAGFSAVTSANGDGGDLADVIAARCKAADAPLLYLAGEHRAVDLEGELRRLGVAAKTRVVYRAVTLPFPPALIEALRATAIGAVTHFSRRSAENYLAGARAADVLSQALVPRQFCLSAQVAEPLAAAGVAVEIAARPDEAALIELVEQASRTGKP